MQGAKNLTFLQVPELILCGTVLLIVFLGKTPQGSSFFLGKVYRMTLHIQTETLNSYFNISWFYFFI